MKKFHRIIVTLICVLSLSTTALAISDNEVMLSEWSATALRAEDILEAKLASTPALETLRAELVVQRTQALALEATSKERIAPLRAQLDAMGPAPEEGEEEALELAARRSELNAALTVASIPLLVAQTGYSRSDGLIREINVIIRTRFSEELVELGPSPVNPKLWPAAVTDLKWYTDRLVGEVRDTFSQDASLVALKQKAPLALFVAFLGIWMLLGFRRGFSEMVGRALALGGEATLWQSTLAELSRFLLPIAGAAALIFALNTSGLVGVWGTAVVSVLPQMALALIAAPWLGRSIFGGRRSGESMIGVSTSGAQAGYGLSIILGVVYSLGILIDAVSKQANYSPETQAVLWFPLILAASFSFYRLSRIMRIKQVVEATEEDEEPHESTVFAFSAMLGRFIFIVAISAPALAAIGYFAAARFLVFPTIITFAFFAALLVLFDLVRAFLDHWIEGEDQELRRDQVRLIPVFVAFLLMLGALPVLALIWGARTSDLAEIWGWLNDGVAIGESRFSLSDLLVFVAVFGVGYVITRLLQKTIRKSVFPRTKLDIGGKTAILSGMGYVGITLAGLAAVSATGLDLSSLAIVAGALSLGIGFGLQTIVSNFVSGIILLIERPIKEGDWIVAGGHEGIVRKISVRATLVDTFDRCAVVIPNSELIAGSVLNWTSPDHTGRLKVQIGVAYGTDAEKVKEILLSIAMVHSMVMKYPGPSVVFTNFGASSLDFELRCFLRDVNYVLSTKSDINFEIYKQFEEAGIEIPFAQSDITLKNIDQIGEVIAGALSGPAKTKG